MENTPNEIRQYDVVLLNDGRTATVVEVLGEHTFIADVGTDPSDWETIDITIDMIKCIL